MRIRRLPALGALTLIAMLALALPAPGAQASTFTVGTTGDTGTTCAVPSSGSCSLRQLIGYENGLAPSATGDTIEIPAGSYSLTLGDLVIGHSMQIAGAGARSVSLYQETTGSTSRVFTVLVCAPGATGCPPTTTPPNVTISGVGMFFGRADSTSSPAFFGGNVLNEANLTLDRDEIADGTANGGSGGGISNDGGTLTLTNSLVDNNTSSGAGGDDSGGIQNFGPNPVTGTAGTLTIANSTIVGNTSSIGGGVMSWCGGTGATACSGVTGQVTTTTIRSSTIAENNGGTRSTTGGGLYAGSPSTISVQGSIVADNAVTDPTTGGSVPSNCGKDASGGAAIDSLGYNLEGGASGGTDCGFTSPGDISDSNPAFLTPLSDLGGPTDVLPLSATSPAVDAIPRSASFCSGADQRGIARPQGAGCDIGAYELFQPYAATAFSTVVGTVAPKAGTTPQINWGDGSPLDSTGQIDPSTHELTGTHTYAAPGVYHGTYSYTNSDGTPITNPFDLKVQVAPPVLTGLSPASGPQAGGTSVTITGTAFTGATAVSFGGVPATSFTVSSDSAITALAPAGTGTVDVTVTTPAGTTATSSADRFTYLPPGGPTGPTGPTGLTGPTGATLPTLAGSAPSVLGSTSAAFTGTVNPNGAQTKAYFEYGIDQSLRIAPGPTYDQTTPVQAVGSDSTAHTVTATVTGLIPNAPYHVRLVATNAAGTATGPDLTFTTAKDPPPPPPTLGKTFDAVPVSGQVFIKLPHGQPLYSVRRELAGSSGLVKGQGYLPLTEPRLIPNASLIDSRAGTLTLVTATGASRASDRNGTFDGAIFGVNQAAHGPTKGLTTLALKESAFPGAPSYTTCKRRAADAVGPSRPPGARAVSAGEAAIRDPFATLAKSSPVLQTLHARDNHGRFRTRGRYSAGTVRGTIWDTSDRCDGTLTTVRRGTVDVFTYSTRRTVAVHAGHSYLAKASARRHRRGHRGSARRHLRGHRAHP